MALSVLIQNHALMTLSHHAQKYIEMTQIYRVLGNHHAAKTAKARFASKGIAVFVLTTLPVLAA
jgi:hypothetical protein